MYKILPILLFAYGLAVTTNDIYDNSYALIIGINEYEHVPKLHHAVSDAESIQEMLTTLFDFPKENITILKNEEANKESILKVFSDITTKAEFNDRVLIFFEGHGETYKLPGGGDMGYLIPVDGTLDNLYFSGISMQSIYDIVDESAAKHILLLFDVAFFGFPSNREYEGVIDPSTPDYIQKIKEAKVRQIITAGSKDDSVLEKAEWGHSAFSMSLLRGLGDNVADSNKDGFITGYELGLFVKNTTLERTDNYQMSTSKKMSPDKGEFIFINNNYGKKDENLYSINRDDIYDDSWAVIIGIDKYKYSDQLNYAVKDAEAVKEMLINKFDYPEENIRYLTDEEATLSNIKLALDDISTSADENDRILVFYSGHGETVPTQDDSEIGYIIPYEGKQKKAYATGLAMDEVLRTSQMSKSKHMLFLMDACYSGLMTENVKGLSKPQEEGYLSKVANEKARQIITAGGKDEQVLERDEWQHSAFTKNLLEGLESWGADYNKDGCITADELSTYLREHVTEDSDFQQTPQDGRFRNSGGGEFVFFSDATVTNPSSDTDEEDEIIYGCMDEGAINYNPSATKPDRSCKYRKEINNLEFGQYKWKKTAANRKIIEVPLLINNMKEVAGLQIDIIGGKVINIWGGITEDKGFEINTNGNTIIAFTTEEDKYTKQPTNPPMGSGIHSGGNQVLFNLQIEPNKTEICINNIVVADLNGKALNSISLDCIRPEIP